MSGALPSDRGQPPRGRFRALGRPLLLPACLAMTLAMLFGCAALPGPARVADETSQPTTQADDPGLAERTAQPTPASSGVPTAPTQPAASGAPSREPFSVPIHSPLARPSIRPTTLSGPDGAPIAVVLAGADYSSRSFAGRGRISAEGRALVIDARPDADAVLVVTWRLPAGALPSAWLAGDLSVAACGLADGASWAIETAAGTPSPVPSAGSTTAPSVAPSAPVTPTSAPASPAASPGGQCWTLGPLPAGQTEVRATVRGGTLLWVDSLEFRPFADD